MSLCDSDMKNNVESSTEYDEIVEELDSLKLLAMIKKLVYTGNKHNLNMCHNKAMSHMNLMNLYQDKFQDIQEFCYQFIAMHKLCNSLGIRFGRCDNDYMAILKKKGIDQLTTAQIKKKLTTSEKNIT